MTKIHYIEQNGYVESALGLTKPPFDKPQSFVKLFDVDKQKKFVSIINEIKEAFDKNGLPCLLSVKENFGHWFPNDLSEKIDN